MTTSTFRTISRATANVALGNIAGMVLLALFMALAARGMSVSEFGLFSAVYALALVTTDVSDAGTGLHLILDSESVSRAVRRQRLADLMLGRVVIHVVIAALALGAGALFDNFAIAVSGSLLAMSMAFRVLLQAEERCERRYLRSSAALVQERAVALLLLLILQPTSASLVLVLIFCGSLTVTVFPTLRLLRQSSTRNIRRLYDKARSFGVSSLSSDLIQLDVPLIGLVAGSVTAGLFAIPSRLLIPIAFVGAAVSTVLVRELPGLTGDQAYRQAYKVLAFVLALVSLVGVLVYFLAPYVVDSWLGPKYSGAVVPLQIAVLTSVMTAGCQVLSASLQALGRQRLVAIVALVSAVSFLSFATLGASLGGAVGASIGCASIQTTQFIFLMSYLFRSGRGVVEQNET